MKTQSVPTLKNVSVVFGKTRVRTTIGGTSTITPALSKFLGNIQTAIESINKTNNASLKRVIKFINLNDGIYVDRDWVWVEFYRGTPDSAMITLRDYFNTGLIYADKPYRWGGPFRSRCGIAFGPRSKCQQLRGGRTQSMPRLMVKW